MPSPFPGMNPYLEQPTMWEDFHNRFMTHAGEALAAQVRPNFFVNLEERVFIHEPSAKERGKFLGKPDIALFDAEATGEMPVAVADPALNKIKSILVSIPDIEIERHAMIEIRDRKDRKLVTRSRTIHREAFGADVQHNFDRGD